MPRLELWRITKAFPGVVANSDISFKVAPGEIHALLGENGAGKSTLVKQIYGILKPDSGDIVWNGQAVHIADPHAARRLGIGMVFQHFSLFEAMTVLENIALGVEGARADAALAARIVEVSSAYGLPLDPSRAVHTLSVGERQRIEIVRCLLQSPSLLIMDEPTSVLTPQEVGRLFETLNKLKAQGCSILYISHKLAEIKALCDSATVLRGGKVVGACDPRAETTRGMAEMMIGAQLLTPARRSVDAQAAAAAPPGFEVAGLSLPAAGPHGTALRDISFAVRKGEIFGIAGVAGNGQNELLLALDGEVPAAAQGTIRIAGRPAGRLDPARRRALGLACVPEERNGHGAVGPMSLIDNAILSACGPRRLAPGGFIDKGAARRFAQEIVATFDVRTPGVESTAGSLSGGNLQKFIVGREILQEPKVLVVAQPTWGVDAAAAAAIHRALLALAERGAAIVVISQDLDELLTLSDRLAVMNVGRLTAPLPTATLSVEEIGLAMGGVHGEEAGHAA